MLIVSSDDCQFTWTPVLKINLQNHYLWMSASCRIRKYWTLTIRRNAHSFNYKLKLWWLSLETMWQKSIRKRYLKKKLTLIIFVDFHIVVCETSVFFGSLIRSLSSKCCLNEFPSDYRTASVFSQRSCIMGALNQLAPLLTDGIFRWIFTHSNIADFWRDTKLGLIPIFLISLGVQTRDFEIKYTKKGILLIEDGNMTPKSEGVLG